MTIRPTNYGQLGGWLLSGSAALGAVAALLYYFIPGNGIDHTPGVILVLVSSILICGASLVTIPDRFGIHWLNVTLHVLIVLGIVGTALAAYMLEANILLLLMFLAICGWLAACFMPDHVEFRRGEQAEVAR